MLIAQSTIKPLHSSFPHTCWVRQVLTQTYPVLSRMACDVLATSATIVPSESAFSTGQRVVSDFRSRLSTDTVEALICLRDWMRVPSPDLLILLVVAPPVSILVWISLRSIATHHVWILINSLVVTVLQSFDKSEPYQWWDNIWIWPYFMGIKVSCVYIVDKWC
jgi:hypothetical protein